MSEKLLDYYTECVRIDSDPEVLAKHKEWLAKKPWPYGVSPIVVAKLAAYSRIYLGSTVADAYRDKIFHK